VDGLNNGRHGLEVYGGKVGEWSMVGWKGKIRKTGSLIT